MYPDEIEYLRLAHDGLGGEHVRQPLYPMFLMACHRLGIDVSLAQLMLHLASSFLLVMLAMRCGLPKTACHVVGWLWILSPYPLAFTHLHLSETLFIFLLLAFLNCCVSGYMITAGLSLGLVILTRQVGCVFLFVLAFVQPRKPLCTGLIAFLLQVPWAVHISYTYNTPWWKTPLVSPGGGHTLFEGFNEKADGGVSKDPLPAVYGDTLLEQDENYRKTAIWWIQHNPVKALALVPGKVSKFFRVMPADHWEWPYTLALLYEVPVILLSLVEFLFIFTFWNEMNTAIRLTTFTVLSFILLHCVFPGSLRYRMPIEPLLVLLAVRTFCGPMPQGDGDGCRI